MKKFTLFAIIILSVASFAFATNKADKEAVEKASMNYLDGFYQGSTDKLKDCLDPNLNKYGYWKDKDAKIYGKPIVMTYDAALKFAQNVQDKKQFPAANAPKEVEVIDVLDKIAITKVIGWWGVDYMMLAKNDDKWMIYQIIWEGPDKDSNPTKADSDAVERAGLNYIEGFYEGDANKLSASLQPNMYKFGYGFNRKENKYHDGNQMTFEKAIAYANRVKESKKFPKANAPKEVEVLGVLNKIAAVKITAWWGHDYMLLSKDGDKWMIEQIIWAGFSSKKN